MKKFLITGYYFDGYHGSMMHICELAEFLKNNNFDVYIAAVHLNKSIKNEIIKNLNINIYHFDKLPLEVEYDYVLAYHDPILTYLLSKGLKYKHIGLGCLSYSAKDVETPSLLTKFNVPIFVCSNELKQVLEKEYLIENIHVIPNFIPESFCINNKIPKELKKVAVVSNHIPEEIIKLKDILKEKNIDTTFYGKNFLHEKISPDILKKYDLIITIGKTVQYSLAMGIPVFNYDIHGGSGYINLANCDKAEFYNFSGRDNSIRRDEIAIANDIIANYQQNLNDIEELQKIAREKYSINKLAKNIIMTMESSKFNLIEAPEWKIYKERCKHLCDYIIHQQNLLFNIHPCLEKQLAFYKKINKITFNKCFKNTIKNLENLTSLIEIDI